MAQPGSSAVLPICHGDKMNDAAVVHLPNYSRRDSRDILFRPPVQPNEAYLKHGEIASPPGPNTGILPATDTFGISSENPRTTPKRLIGDGGRYLAYPSGEREWEQDNRENRTRPRLRYQLSNSEYRGEYIEEGGYEDYDQPRVYRRPSRRANTRPPPAHQYFSSGQGRYSRDQPRSSYDFPRPSMDYEPDTPTKPHTQQYYSEDEEALRGVRYPRGPPRRPPATEEVLRLPWTMWMNSNAKNHFVAFVGEFVGTTMFLFFAFSGTQVANIGSSATSHTNTTTGADTGFSPQVLQYIALVFAFSLMVNVWIFFRISGGLFNPAVTFAMLLTKAMTPVRFALLLVAQLSGSIFASFLVSVMFPTPLNVRTTLSAETSLVRGVFIEAVLTAELVFTIFMLAKEKHKATFIAPVGIGLALFIAELVGVYYTGGSLNPARSFGPCVVAGVFDREHWIYWVGPAIGAVLAVVFYNFIKVLEYEMANPDQDANEDDIKEKVEQEGA